MQSMLIQMAISFIVRQLLKFGDSIEWEKVKGDLVIRVKKLVPGTFFDDEAEKLVEIVLDHVAMALSDVNLWTEILSLIAQGKTKELLDKLIEIVKDKLGL